MTLTYEGKRAESDILKTPPAAMNRLWPRAEADIRDAGSRLYFGDNLPILASLMSDTSLQGQVRMIYIDPPFATRSVFLSRSQRHAYADLIAGPHYLEFLRERLVLLRELLADDGSIYVHLDDNMAFHVKVIMDEVFGSKNFRNWVTRKKCNPKNYTRKAFGNVADYILFYTKSANYVWNRQIEAWSEERRPKEYRYVEPGTGRYYMKVPLHAPGERHGDTGKAWRGMLPPPGKHWQYTPARLDEMDSRGEIYWSPNGNPRRKVYLDESQGVPVQDIWLEFRDAHNQNIKVSGYPTEKNPDLIKRLILASSNDGDTVLDCFSGSGTTLVCASELGRRWIGIDNGVEAIDTTLHRFAHGLGRMGDFVRVKKAKARVEQPELFLQSGELLVDEPVGKRGSIADFTLFAEAERVPELSSALAEWRGVQSDI